MLACSAMVACTNTDEPEVDNGGAKGNESYLAVKLVNPSAGSRATSNYAYGSEAEQTVTSARFYLFDANDKAYLIDDASTNKKNFVDASKISSPENDGFTNTGNTNVETVLEAVLVIDQSKKMPPASIVAVLNYTDQLGDDPKDLDDLMDITENFGTINDATSPAPYIGTGKFVMSNSVYKDATGKIVIQTPIAAENICDKKGEGNEVGALDSPVIICVERVAAKVQTSVNFTTAEGTADADKGKFFKNGDYYYANTSVKDAAGNDIYARLKGWKVTNITEESNLIKSLNNTYSFTWNWNNPNDYRSYWANASETPKFAWSFNETNLSFDDNNWEYYNENTNNTTIEGTWTERKNSQLLVAVEFVTKDKDGDLGEPQPIAEWYGVKYTLDGLREVVANSLANKLYTTTDNKTFVSIDPSAISFAQVEANLQDDRYISKIVIADNTYYYKNGESMVQYESTEVDDIESALQTVKIWGNMVEEGETQKYVGGGYYYIDIVHDASTATKAYGLVRNHWYKLTLNSLSGLGTPVYDPDKVITTETPESDASFIAAEINVLAWRMVEQGVDFK